MAFTGLNTNPTGLNTNPIGLNTNLPAGSSSMFPPTNGIGATSIPNGGFTPPPLTTTAASFFATIPGGLSTLAMVGIALGVLAGLLLLILVICLVGWCCCRSTNQEVTKIKKIHRYRQRKSASAAAIQTVYQPKQPPQKAPQLVLDDSVTSHSCNQPKCFIASENDKRLVPSTTLPTNTIPSAIYSPCATGCNAQLSCTRLIPSTPLPPPVGPIYPAAPSDINIVLPSGNFQQQATTMSSQMDNDIRVTVRNPGDNYGASAPGMSYGYDHPDQYGSKVPLGSMGFQSSGIPPQSYGGLEPYHGMYPSGSMNQSPQGFQQMNQYGAVTSSTGYLFTN